jgi:8-amino-7-oxononanoate synthase
MDLFHKCDETPFGKQLQASGFDAYYRVIQSPQDTEVVVYGRRMLMLGSNNYLGLANDPRVKRAAAEAAERWGAGTGGSRVLNGTLDLHLGLERRLARFLHRDDAIFYTSGYMTNLGVISSLAQRGDFIVADRRAHASILDATRLSTAEVKRFRHNDVDDLERVLESCGDAGVLVAIDGVYSMDGDIAPLPRILRACRDHGARLLMDDAHGLGVLGKTGRGTAEFFDLEDEVDVIIGTTSKALPGLGGFAAADQRVIDFLRYSQINRPFLFATSPPPSVLASVQAALELIDEDPSLRTRLWSITQRVHRSLRAMGFDTGHSETPIVPVLVGSVERTFAVWQALTEEGLFVNVVLPPAVPAGACLIRMTFTAAMTDAQIDRVLDTLERVGTRLGVIAAASEVAPAMVPGVVPGVAEIRKAG